MLCHPAVALVFFFFKQKTAYEMRISDWSSDVCSSDLGPAWLMAGDTPVYRPWSIFPWWYHYDAYAPHIFDKAGMLAGASGFLGCAAAIAGSLWRARQSRQVTTYGSARWATPREIEERKSTRLNSSH